jgi:hypothetical protein
MLEMCDGGVGAVVVVVARKKKCYVLLKYAYTMNSVYVVIEVRVYHILGIYYTL